MEVLSIIPVRGGSKGIPGKNIKMLCGKPLVAYTIEASRQSKCITRTIVSTEDKKIKTIAESFGAEVIDRPVELAQDTTMTAPVLLHVLDELEKQNYIPDVVILLQATCPLRTCEDIDNAFNLFAEKITTGCDSVFAATDLGFTHALWRKEHNKKFSCLYDYHTRPRRQDIDKHYKMFCENGSIYIIKTDVMRELKDFVGNSPELYIMPPSVDIDEVSDFERVEMILKQRKNTVSL